MEIKKITEKERYKYRPPVFTDNENLPRKDVFCTPSLRSENIEKYNLVYEKDQISVISLDITVPNGAKKVVVLNHMPSKGYGELHVKTSMEKNSSLVLIDLVNSRSHLKSELLYDIDRNCNLEVYSLDVDNKSILKNQVFNLNAEGSKVSLKGLFMSSEGEYSDNYVKMNHMASHCESYQDYRGVSSGYGSFLGHILIAQDSQKSVAMQQSKNIVLRDGAEIYARPWLEIYADDVKCNHGVTVGSSDDESLYYMRQRGIPEQAAKVLLLQGFVNEMLSGASSYSKNVKTTVNRKLSRL